MSQYFQENVSNSISNPSIPWCSSCLSLSYSLLYSFALVGWWPVFCTDMRTMVYMTLRRTYFVLSVYYIYFVIIRDYVISLHELSSKDVKIYCK